MIDYFQQYLYCPPRPDYNNELEGMAGVSHFGSEWGKTVSQPTLLVVIIVKKD
jgi:hypothetical protein